jgi:hypothetical protein
MGCTAAFSLSSEAEPPFLHPWPKAAADAARRSARANKGRLGEPGLFMVGNHGPIASRVNVRLPSKAIVARSSGCGLHLPRRHQRLDLLHVVVARRQWAHGSPMRFFFNLAGAVHYPDNLGYQLATMSDARMMAAKEVALTLHDRPDLAWRGEEVRLEVTDEHRTLLFTVVVMGVDGAAARQLP